MGNINIFFVLSCVFFSSWSLADAFDQRADIYDFFVQDLCLGKDGYVDRSRLPHECEERRNMRPGDRFYYRTHARYDDPREQFRYGNDAWSSYPVVEAVVRRILLMKDNGKIKSNGDAFGVFDDNDGVSLRWMASVDNGYGFLLFTASPKQAGFGMTYKNCNRYIKSESRYYDNWIHGPKNIDLLSLDVPWGKTTRVRLVSSINPETCVGFICTKREVIPKRCGEEKFFKYAFHFSVRTNGFLFTNNKRMETIVNQKFSPGNSFNKGPTSSKTFERIYLTREYGVTRWEKWQREDNLNYDPKRSMKLLTSMTSKAEKGERICTRPYEVDGAPVGMGFQTGTYSKDSKGYYEKYKDGSTGDGYEKWYLMDCVDVTGKILIGESLEEAYEYDRNRINFKPDVEVLLKEVSDPDHELFNLFF